MQSRIIIATDGLQIWNIFVGNAKVALHLRDACPPHYDANRVIFVCRVLLSVPCGLVCGERNQISGRNACHPHGYEGEYTTRRRHNKTHLRDNCNVSDFTEELALVDLVVL